MLWRLNHPACSDGFGGIGETAPLAPEGARCGL